MDMMYWNKDGSHISRTELISQLNNVFDCDEWIIDGNYKNTLEMRMQQCELIYLFDLPTEVCIQGVLHRSSRPDMPCDLPVDDTFINFIKNFNIDRKSQIIKLMNKYADKKVITFKSHEEVDSYIEDLKDSFEYWDVYDKNRNRTGKIISRYDFFHKKDLGYHLCVHVWIKNDRGEWLISKRTPNKSFPLLWECTGGSVLAGESSIEGALREVKEELGINLNSAKGYIFKSIVREVYHDFCDVWVFEHNCELKEVVFQENETCAAMWASNDELNELINTKQFVPLDNMQYVYELLNS